MSSDSVKRIGLCLLLVGIAMLLAYTAVARAACTSGCKEFTCRRSSGDPGGCVEYKLSTAESLYSTSPDGGTATDRDPAETVLIRGRGECSGCAWDERPYAGTCSGSGGNDEWTSGSTNRQYCKKGT